MEYQISKFLNDFLEKKEITITTLSKKIGVSHAYISYIKNGTKTSSEKFIKSLIKEYPILKEKEKKLLEMLDQDKKIEKLRKYEKKRRQIIGKDDELNKLSKRERVQLNDVMSSANHFFNDQSVSEEDKKKLYDSLQELYFDAKAKNKNKRKKS